MLVSFGFFKGDTILHKGALYIEQRKGMSVYGEHKHYILPDSSIEVQLFGGLVIEHEFEAPACPVTIKYFGIEPGSSPTEPYRQIQHLNAALRMGVHDSEDWESLQLIDYTLGFKCSLSR